MRISQQEHNVIISYARTVFGENVEVFLFGSRADDDKRGGDIDLMVDLKGCDYDVAQKFKLQSLLQLSLGDQKFDVVITRDRYRDERLVVREALPKGVQL